MADNSKDSNTTTREVESDTNSPNHTKFTTTSTPVTPSAKKRSRSADEEELLMELVDDRLPEDSTRDIRTFTLSFDTIFHFLQSIKLIKKFSIFQIQICVIPN